jgi:LysM repeat protein
MQMPNIAGRLGSYEDHRHHRVIGEMRESLSTPRIAWGKFARTGASVRGRVGRHLSRCRTRFLSISQPGPLFWKVDNISKKEVLMASFEEQKTKYQSVIQIVQSQGIQVANLHQQDGKLFIKGVAPSVEAANKVWDEIKRINPKLDDITAEFPVDPSMASKVQTYTVKSGDTLSKISKQFYGNPKDYMRIFNANRDKLNDPDKIDVGQELKIPAA